MNESINDVLRKDYDSCVKKKKKIEKAREKLEKKLEDIKFYIDQSDIKNMLWGKEILKIIGDDKNEK